MSIWSEIKSKIKQDIESDINQILGLTKGRKGLGLDISNRIEPIRVVNTGVTRQVENLVDNNRPFTEDQDNLASNDNKHGRKHDHKHSCHKHRDGHRNGRRK